MAKDASDSEVGLERLRRGDLTALGDLWESVRARLKRTVQLRMDSRLAARLDPSDVLQETFLDVQRQLHGYLDKQSVSFYVWVRKLAIERVVNLHEQHLAAKCRTVKSEAALPLDSSAMLARELLSRSPSPSHHVREQELAERVQLALGRLPAADREIILMRHFEAMRNTEVAETLGLTSSAVTMRYGRALLRLRKMLLSAST